MNEKTIRLGLVGKDVSASTSDKIHKFILREKGVRCEYERFSVSPDRFDLTMRTLLGDFDGFNVTIPYKRDVFEYLDGVYGDALACGSVNTVISATRQGYNTDAEGFLLMLEAAGIAVDGKKTLILGAGGSGRSSAAALKRKGALVTMYRRNRVELKEVCEQLGVAMTDDPEEGGYDLVINCTGIGMHDTVGRSPVGAKAFAGAETAVDLIYVPKQTEFLRLAQTQGLKTLNGESMLFYQAYFSDCLFLNETPSCEEAQKLYDRFLQEE